MGRGEYYDNKDRGHTITSRIVNKYSINMTPFKTIRLYYKTDYYLNSNGLDALGYGCAILSNDNKHSVLKSIDNLYAGFLVDTVTDIDISNINTQAFFSIGFACVSRTTQGGSVYISKIEFLT
ncbi:hypothetical protein BXY41_104432 [Lacrimispora xylanisolvens]|uniref:Uncharacterized protein n=1 Tax=Lacrimispora xylanisolvens TaxID=384636 RepID=A0A2S6HUW3_9FIRM|nr:hypothetical protein [Hungatella xylanolytica]PPK81629.1 hypothetical protein BXY41_104432 [Hungatella xylanolytica]